MKKLTCEMCGSSDLMKQDGVFVCQSCGMKYSVEDAKKMMIEGTVEVQGAVQVKNSAQFENLLELAQNSYDAKNYAQAEAFCNQAIAMNANSFDAWFIKGKAINYQITGENDRIEEAYKCILTAYRTLDEDEKADHRETVLSELRTCLEGEIDFAIDLFAQNRPTEALLKKVKETFVRCATSALGAYKELGYSEEKTEYYKSYLRNYYIKKVNALCENDWDNKVLYNYQRGGFNQEYHPTRSIMDQYVSEAQVLVLLLQDAEQYFDSVTPAKERLKNYTTQRKIGDTVRKAASYKLMEHTTTNGYGAVLSRYESWEDDVTLSVDAQVYWIKLANRAVKLCDEAEMEIAASDPHERERMVSKWRQELAELKTGYRPAGGPLFGAILFGVGAWAIFKYVPGLFGTILGYVVAAFAGILFLGSILIGRDKQKEKQAQAERLRNKIAEATAIKSTSTPQSAPKETLPASEDTNKPGEVSDYVSGRTYRNGDLVRFEGEEYVCVCESSAGTVWSPKQNPKLWNKH